MTHALTFVQEKLVQAAHVPSCCEVCTWAAWTSSRKKAKIFRGFQRQLQIKRQRDMRKTSVLEQAKPK